MNKEKVTICDTYYRFEIRSSKINKTTRRELMLFVFGIFDTSDDPRPATPNEISLARDFTKEFDNEILDIYGFNLRSDFPWEGTTRHTFLNYFRFGECGIQYQIGKVMYIFFDKLPAHPVQLIMKERIDRFFKLKEAKYTIRKFKITKETREEQVEV